MYFHIAKLHIYSLKLIVLFLSHFSKKILKSSFKIGNRKNTRWRIMLKLVLTTILFKWSTPYSCCLPLSVGTKTMPSYSVILKHLFGYPIYWPIMKLKSFKAKFTTNFITESFEVLLASQHLLGFQFFQ